MRFLVDNALSPLVAAELSRAGESPLLKAMTGLLVVQTKKTAKVPGEAGKDTMLARIYDTVESLVGS